MVAIYRLKNSDPQIRIMQETEWGITSQIETKEYRAMKTDMEQWLSGRVI